MFNLVDAFALADHLSNSYRISTLRIVKDITMKLTLGLSCLVALSLPLIASSAYSSESLEGMVVTKDMLSHKYPGKEYSPYAERDYPIFPLWGETHLHTGYSMDAGLFGARLGHEEAYKLAKGEQIKTSNGQKVKLSRPLRLVSYYRSLRSDGYDSRCCKWRSFCYEV